MSEPSFVRYLGDADFHDGRVLDLERREQSITVRVRGGSGRVFVVEFGNVLHFRAIQPKGMLLYALSEFTGPPPLRRFVFANWDDEAKSILEVEAETIQVRPE